jgi:hypothetical protein
MTERSIAARAAADEDERWRGGLATMILMTSMTTRCSI